MSKFIVIEGLEGAGKSTAIAVVKQWLQEQGITDVITTREPGGTPIAEKLREIIKTQINTEMLLPISELLLMYAARVQLVQQIIQPALARNTWVIGDRHELSTRAYQGGGRGIAPSTLQALYDMCLAPFKPDLTLYLDISPNLGLERVSLRGQKDRIEQEPLPFFERVRAVYIDAAQHDSSVVFIDASQAIAQVHTSIINVLMQYFGLTL